MNQDQAPASHNPSSCPHCVNIHSKVESLIIPMDDRVKRIESSTLRIVTAIMGDKEYGAVGLVQRTDKQDERIDALEEELGAWKVMKAKLMLIVSIGTAAITAAAIKAVNVLGFDFLKK